MLPVEFENALKDWQEVEFGNLKTNYERTRLSIFYNILSQSTKGISYQEFCKDHLPYPWDEEKEFVMPTIEDFDFMTTLGASGATKKDLTLEEIAKLTG